MKKKITWHEQLDEIVIDNIFGHNIEWDVKDVRKYILKLEALGATNIVIMDLDSIRFELPAEQNQAELLLFILTSGGAAGRMPSSVDHNKKKNTLRLNFDW
jgi:hypothetical protein